MRLHSNVRAIHEQRVAPPGNVGFDQILRPRNVPAGPGRFQGPGTNALIQGSKPFNPLDEYQVASIERPARVASREAYVARELRNPNPNPARELEVLGPHGAAHLSAARARLAGNVQAVYSGIPSLAPGPSGGTEKPIRRYTPAYEGEQPAGHEVIPGKFIGVGKGAASAMRPYYEVHPDTRSPLEQSVDYGLEKNLGSDLRQAQPGLAGQVFRAMAEGLVPSTLEKVAQGDHASLGGVLADVALFSPWFRGGRAAVAGVQAATRGERAVAAARAAFQGVTDPHLESATVEAAFRTHRGENLEAITHEIATKYGVAPQALTKQLAKSDATVKRILSNREVWRNERTVKLGDLEQQFPESPSFVTAKGQRLLDRYSEHLTGKVDQLRSSDSALSRAAGHALTPASARGRVPKQAGKFVRQEARRHQAGLAEELKTVNEVGKGRLPLVRNEGEQLAHFWYAQLPTEYRNGKGLQLVRGRLSEELQGYTSGTASADLEHELASLRAEQRAASSAGDQTKVFQILNRVERVKQIQADIPARISDISENIGKLDRVIAKPPKADPDVIDSLGALMRDRQDILTRAGKLDPAAAGQREGLVSRWLGLQPTGEEVYLGHRLGRVRGSRASGLPGGVSIGRTRAPQGVGTHNALQLARTGRVRQSLRAPIEDWQAAQVYDFHNIAKDELARMGEPIVGVPKPGYVVINPRGHELPRHWKVDDHERALEEGFNPESVLISDVNDYLHNYMGYGAEAHRLVEQAAAAGHLNDLRQVPADVVKRYFGQFVTPKITAATPGIQESAGLVGKGADFINDALYASLIHSNPGYIPANTVQNLAMAGLQQGAFLPINLIRAGQVLTQAPPRLRNLIKAEIGTGGSAAASSGTSPLKRLGHVVSSISDDPYRISAFIHEAARVGVIPRTKPVLGKADYKKLEEFLTDPKNRPLLNDVRDRGVQAMVDFERLGPMERSLAKRLLFVWSWIRGATRYPFRFALDHPTRSALLAYAAAGEPGSPVHNKPITDYLQGEMPPWLENSIKTGTTNIGGKDYPQILPTRATSPVSTTLETLGTLTSRPGAQTLADLLNPGLREAMHVAAQESPYGAKLGSYGDAAAQAGQRLAPDYGLLSDLISPPNKPGLYPGDSSRLGRLERASRIFPIAVNPDAAFKAREREGMVTRHELIDYKTKSLIDDSHLYLHATPPQAVISDLKWHVDLVQLNLRGLKPHEKALKVAQLYDERYGTKLELQAAKLHTEGEAKLFVKQLTPSIAPAWTAWERTLNKVIDRGLEAQQIAR